MTLGEKIKELRTQKGLTIADLEKLTGLNKMTISNIENNKTKNRVFAITLQKLATALDCSYEELEKVEEHGTN